MDDRDLKNVHFLLALSREELIQWYDTISVEEQIYANQILKDFSQELRIKDILYKDNVEDLKDLSAANDVLSRYRL